MYGIFLNKGVLVCQGLNDLGGVRVVRLNFRVEFRRLWPVLAMSQNDPYLTELTTPRVIPTCFRAWPAADLVRPRFEGLGFRV